MTRPTVTICAADAGCAESLIPVIRCLDRRLGYRVFADGAGGAANRFDGEVSACSIAALTDGALPEKPRLLLTATPGKRQQFAVAASQVARERGACVVWIETMYHAARTGLNRSFVPDHLIVLDDFAAAPYRRTGDDQPYGATVHPLGQPAFDGLSALSAETLRADHGLTLEDRLLAYFASSSGQVDPYEALEPLSRALQDMPHVVLLPRFHPADPQKADLERYLRGRCPRLLFDRSSDVEILRRADAVAVQFSTVGLKAVHLRRPVLYLWTESVVRHFASGAIANAEFPPIQEGAALVARNRDQIRARLPQLIHDETVRNALLTRQQSRFPAQPNSAQAIADLIVALAEGRRP